MLCAVAVVVRGVLAWQVHVPWIMSDELIYRDLATSFADTGRLAVRGQSIGLVTLYPVAISPLWRLHSLRAAYEWSKLLDCVVMTAASGIVFVWARRLTSELVAFALGVVSLLLPAYAYTGELMTETFFLPAFLLAAFTIARCLPDPTRRRQLEALGAVLLACLVRSQGVVLLPAWAGAALVWRAYGGELALRRYRLTLGAAGAALAVLLVAGAVRGLGFYGGVTDQTYSIGAAAKWIGYSLAELTLAAALVPAAAFLLLLWQARRVRPPDQVLALLAVTAATVVCLAVGAGVWASWHGEAVRERYLLYAVPLLLLCFGVWLEQATRLSPRSYAAAACVCLAPLVLPLGLLLGDKALSDEQSLTGLLWVRNHGSLAEAQIVLLVVAVCAGVLVAVRGRFAALPLVAAILLANSAAASTFAIQQADRIERGAPTDAWVDRAVGTNANVSLVATGNVDPMQLDQTEFWNRSVKRVAQLGSRTADSLPTAMATIDAADGRLRLFAGPTDAVVTDSSLALGTRQLAATKTGLRLDAYGTSTTVSTVLEGLYADSWTGPAFSYTQPACRGVTHLVFAFRSSAYAPGPQRAVVRQGGRVVDSATVAPGEDLSLRAPLDAAAGPCTLHFSFTPWSPAHSEPGSSDDRALGLLYRATATIP